jgi:hypothetical protein
MAKAYVAIDLYEVPHLTKERIDETLKGVPAWQRKMRLSGIPEFGTGAIYPIPEAEITVTPFALPPHWLRAYGFDVGWRVNAAVFGAYDPAADILYIYDEVYTGRTEPTNIANAIKARGAWIPGVIDPAAGGTQKDGKSLMADYRALGLDVDPAENAVIAGTTRVWERLSQGKLKIFTSCQKLLGEYRLYRRDERGKIVESPDHALDALRYLVMSGIARAIVEPKTRPGDKPWYHVKTDRVWAG